MSRPPAWQGLASVAVALGLAALGPCAGTADEPPPAQAPCQEDEPCWDCETMGNLLCGPQDPPLTAPTA